MPFLPSNKKEMSEFAMIIPYILALIVTIAYFLLPIDLIPDFLIGIGQADDIGVGIFSFVLAHLMSSSMAPRKG